MSSSRSRELHNRLGHPVIDSDWHFAEVMPVFFDNGGQGRPRVHFHNRGFGRG